MSLEINPSLHKDGPPPITVFQRIDPDAGGGPARGLNPGGDVKHRPRRKVRAAITPPANNHLGILVFLQACIEKHRREVVPERIDNTLPKAGSSLVKRNIDDVGIESGEKLSGKMGVAKGTLTTESDQHNRAVFLQ